MTGSCVVNSSVVTGNSVVDSSVDWPYVSYPNIVDVSSVSLLWRSPVDVANESTDDDGWKKN